MITLRPVDKHPPGPVCSTLGGFHEDEPAFASCPMNLRLRPQAPDMFTWIGQPPNRTPMLCGLTLAPRPAGELRRALAAAGKHGVLLSQDHAETIAVTLIRTHRWRATRYAASAMFNNWLAHAFGLGAAVAPLLHRLRVMREVELSLNKIGSTSAVGEAA